MTKQHAPIIHELEGLRGLLALWVFVFHTLRFCGIKIPLISDGILPVNVFMILSGFVICGLISKNNEPYPTYMARRAARIYPAYLISLAFGITVSALLSWTYSAVPWSEPEFTDMITRHHQESQNFIPLLLGHLTLLHGLFPDEILKPSSLAFVGPAWSLSLEWQFYLVAPFLVYLLTRARTRLLTIAAVLIVCFLTPRFLQGYTYRVPSFLPIVIAYFVLGMATSFVYEQLKSVREELLIYGAAAMIFTGVCAATAGSHSAIPLIIWVIAILSSLGLRSPELHGTSRALVCGPVKFLGRISYGFYVYHISVNACVAAILITLGIHTRFAMLGWMMIISLPLTLILSAASYRFIELPVMRYAKRKLS